MIYIQIYLILSHALNSLATTIKVSVDFFLSYYNVLLHLSLERQIVNLFKSKKISKKYFHFIIAIHNLNFNVKAAI